VSITSLPRGLDQASTEPVTNEWPVATQSSSAHGLRSTGLRLAFCDRGGITFVLEFDRPVISSHKLGTGVHFV
jgi:hypothetical protein